MYDLIIYNFNFISAAQLWKQRTNEEDETFDSIREKFYEMTSQTFENECMVIKKFGGKWSSSAKIIDGQKPVCLDKMYKDIQNGNCLVYSFGVGDDFTFETAMAGLGCTVRAFDLYVDTKDKSFVTNPNITFSYTGLSHVKGKIELGNSNEIFDCFSILLTGRFSIIEIIVIHISS